MLELLLEKYGFVPVVGSKGKHLSSVVIARQSVFPAWFEFQVPLSKWTLEVLMGIPNIYSTLALQLS